MSDVNDRKPEDRVPRWTRTAADIEEMRGMLDDLERPQAAPPRGAADAGPADALERGVQWAYDQAFDSFQVAACSITATMDPGALVREILDAAIRSLGAERGILFLGRPESSGLIPVMARSVRGEELQKLERVSRTIVQRGEAGEVLILPDASVEPTLRDAESIPLKSIRSVLCAPLERCGERIGVLYLDAPSTRWTFPEGVGRFLRAFADLSAITLENARLFQDVKLENRRLRKRAAVEPFERIVGFSAAMHDVLERAALAASVDMPILLLGETGTGKGLIARTIHDVSRRAENDFVHYNCAAIPEELMESIFFGYVRGAFTGAYREAKGIFREADGGTLFLDEISKMNTDLQAKLLRAVDEGLARPVGGDSDYSFDTRMITASLPDLHRRLDAGSFLKELYHRINVIELNVPPLRERPEDIPPLVDHFLHVYSGDQGPKEGVRFAPDALEYLQSLPWKGNVRELRNTVLRVLVFAERTLVDADQLRRFVPAIDPEPVHDVDHAEASEEAEPGFVALVDREREAIRQALVRSGGNKSQAARMLGLHRNTLLRKIQKLKIQPLR